VQRPYNDTVKETVELCFLTIFQHVFYPTRIRTIADENAAARPRDLCPTAANELFKGNSIEVQGQFNRTMDMPSTGCAAFARA